jgi:hypothetical protein
VPASAQVGVSVGIGLPPPIAFATPPELIVIPETYVYVVPDVADDIFFYEGWWWRPWGGRWYRSRHYSSGWVYYGGVPAFYASVPVTWRNDYRNHRWYGRPWNYQRIPQYQVQRNWNQWQRTRHWENQQTWGVQGLERRDHRQGARVANPPYQPRSQAEQRPQPHEGYNPRAQAQPQPPAAVNPQYQGRPQGQARPPEGVNPQYQARPQGQPRPQAQEGANPQYQARPQGQPRPPAQVTAVPPQPQGAVAPQPPPVAEASPPPTREGRPQGGRPEREPRPPQ